MNVVKFKRPGRNDTKLDYATFVQMQEWLERLANCAFSQDFVVDKTGVLRVGLRKMGVDMDYSDFAFGFSVSGAVVTVNAGKVRHGTRTPISVAGDDLTIGVDQSYIFVAYAYGSGTAALGTPTPTEPVDTEEVHNHILYLVTLTAGVASIESGNIKHLGDIWLPGSFA